VPNVLTTDTTEDDMKNLGLPTGEFVYHNGLQEIEIYPEDVGLESEGIYLANGGNQNSDFEKHSESPIWLENFQSPISDFIDSKRDRLLLNHEGCYKFYPVFNFDDRLPVAAPVGSVAAALIANAYTSPEDRIATILRDRTEKIAKAGLTFVDGLRAFNQAGIDNM
jgi:hypothetical protein